MLKTAAYARGSANALLSLGLVKLARGVMGAGKAVPELGELLAGMRRPAQTMPTAGERLFQTAHGRPVGRNDDLLHMAPAMQVGGTPRKPTPAVSPEQMRARHPAWVDDAPAPVAQARPRKKVEVAAAQPQPTAQPQPAAQAATPAAPAAQPAAAPAATAAPAAAAAAPAEGAAADPSGPFAKLRSMNIGPKAAAGLGLVGGGAYLAHGMSQDPQMSVTPSAPLAYYP